MSATNASNNSPFANELEESRQSLLFDTESEFSHSIGEIIRKATNSKWPTRHFIGRLVEAVVHRVQSVRGVAGKGPRIENNGRGLATRIDQALFCCGIRGESAEKITKTVTEEAKKRLNGQCEQSCLSDASQKEL